MKLYSYIWNERGTSKEQGANEYLEIVLAHEELEDKKVRQLDGVEVTFHPTLGKAIIYDPSLNRLRLRFYRSIEGEIVLCIKGTNRIRVEDKRR